VPEILVLGPLRIVADNGREVAPTSDLQRTLLAVLAARRGRAVSADELIDALWGDRLPEHPASALQSQIFRLRRLLGDADSIGTEGAGYRLHLPADGIDAERFEVLVATARGHRADTAEAIGRYDDALVLWRGRAFEDAAEAEAPRLEAVRLEELRVTAAEERALLLLQAGRPGEAAASLASTAVDHPFREALVAIRMRSLAAMGRHAEAVRAFAEFRRTLGDELGLEPSPDLAALEVEILGHERGTRPTVGLPGNSFLGRELDLATVVSALSTARLVTLTGPGGIGKTRLALHAAARTADDYPDGTVVIELADVDTSASVAAAAATALALHDVADIDRIVAFLRTRTALLLVDNCEHVLDGVRALVAAVLTQTPNVRVLATSRSRLGVGAEQVIPLNPLPVPDREDPDAPAVVLFGDRAAAVRPGFMVTDENLATVTQLCRRLDGIPLAIELAAARILTRTLPEILAEVTDHVDLLADRHRSTARHRSLAGVIDWSYSLLGQAQQDLFLHAAVFAGGFTAPAATAVIASLPGEVVEEGLTELVEHSLLNAIDVDGETRFSMLEPIREHAASRLADTGQLEALRARHAGWFARWITEADDGLRSEDELRVARAIAHELANLRVAHGWALDHDPATAADIAAALYWYAFWYGATEVSGWALAAIERQPPTGTATVGAYATGALGTWRRGDFDAAQELAERAIKIAGPDAIDARFAWEALSSTALLRGDYPLARTAQETAHELALRAGDLTHAARERAALALTLGYLDRLGDAHLALADAQTLADRARNPSITAFCDYVAGELLLEAAPHDALPRLSRARDAARLLGNQYLAAIAGASAVSCASRLGQASGAVGDYAELLDYFDRTGSIAQQWTVVRSLIETLARIRDDEAAAVLLGALETTTTGTPLIGGDAERIIRVRTTLRRRLGKARFENATAAGEALDDPAALAFARQHAKPPRTKRKHPQP
jgi:predicted ATPase/DNA-binding SARP family transcriptional activator